MQFFNGIQIMIGKMKNFNIYQTYFMYVQMYSYFNFSFPFQLKRLLRPLLPFVSWRLELASRCLHQTTNQQPVITDCVQWDDLVNTFTLSISTWNMTFLVFTSIFFPHVICLEHVFTMKTINFQLLLFTNKISSAYFSCLINWKIPWCIALLLGFFQLTRFHCVCICFGKAKRTYLMGKQFDKNYLTT